MLLAIAEAEQGLGLTSPNPPVGAVIWDGKSTVLGKGWHQKAGDAHAEIEALSHARETFGDDRIRGSILFVTMEPCSTHGKTPPCVEAIIEAGISRVAIGCLDPNPAHAGAAVSILKNAGIEVATGICEEKAKQLIRFFARHITTGLPYVIAKSAVTLDGRTTLPEGEGRWISSEASREDVQSLRRQVDAVLIGGETMRVDNPSLTLRGPHSAGRELPPLRVVLTGHPEQLPESHRLFSDQFVDRTVIIKGNSLADALTDLGGRGVTSVLLESGGRLFTEGIFSDLIQEVVLYIAPLLGGASKRLMPDTEEELLARLEHVSVEKIGCDIKVSGILE